MKNKVLFIAMFLVAFLANSSFAQNAQMTKHYPMKAVTETTTAKTIQLEQTTGVFTIQGLTLSEGTYIFEVANNGIDHAVGLVIAPKSNPDAHIKAGYVQEAVENGKTSSSKEVTLTKGEYIYFCPLNPTPQYTITVE